MTGSFASALGALAAGYLTYALQASWAPVDSYRTVVIAYACLGIVLALIFAGASSALEASSYGQPVADGPLFARLS